MIDIILLIALIFGFVRGLWNGFFVELSSLVSLFAGIYLAIWFSDAVTHVLAALFPWPVAATRIAVFLLMILLVIVGISLLAKVVTKIASLAMMGILNRLAGAILGLLKMALLLGVLLYLWEGITGSTEGEKSLIYRLLENTSEFFIPVAKEWLQHLKNDLMAEFP